MLMEPFSIALICLFSKEMVQPLHMEKPWIWLLCSVRVDQEQLWLSDPWCKEIRSCSKGNAIRFMLQNYKTIILVRKFWRCKGDRSLSGDAEPRDAGEMVSHVDYHFFFLEKGLWDVSRPRAIRHSVAPFCLVSSGVRYAGWKTI